MANKSAGKRDVEKGSLIRQIIFILALIFCVSPLASPPIALALGLLIALSLGHPYLHFSRRATKILLQISVVGLGFGMNLGQVMEAGRRGVLFTIVSIAGTLMIGYLIGRALGINAKTSHLISSGTAICGGSAIAAVGPVLDASEEEMSVALGTVFILNSIALFIFPPIGHHFNLSQAQFGMWVAIAIHDTSSVVGAAARFGNEALQIAAPVKLARALWIVPLVFLTALLFKRKTGRVSIPYFILFFLLASVLRTYVSTVAYISDALVALARTGLTVTLFLIGAGLSRKTLKAVGIRPLIHGVLLWIIISCAAFWAALSLM